MYPTNLKIYHSKNTITCLEKLIILESFFCINRSYLINSSKARFYCKLIFFVVIVSVVATTVNDFYFYASQMSISMLCFQVVIGCEVFYLSITARDKNSLKSLTRLDEKCGVDDEYLKSVKSSVSKTVLIGVVSSILDVGGAMLIVSKASVIITLCIATAVHDAEMAFYSILFEGINLRLAVIDKLSIHLGWKVYRHVLITALNLSEEFTARILLMLASTLLTTVVYSVVFILADSEIMPRLAVVLIWRELKALYSLWVLSATAAETKSICNDLSFVLAGRLALYSKDKKSKQHQATRQLLACLKSQRPRYLSGMILSMDLALPVDLIDLSVNYLLIIVQVDSEQPGNILMSESESRIEHRRARKKLQQFVLGTNTTIEIRIHAICLYFVEPVKAWPAPSNHQTKHKDSEQKSQSKL